MVHTKIHIKRALNIVLILVIINGIYIKPVDVHAAGASDWSLDIRNLSHYNMTLYVSGVDKAQDATAYIVAGTDSFTKVLKFTNATQIFNLTFDRGYDAGTDVTVFLQDSEGNMSDIESAEINEDYLDVWGDASPKMFAGEIYGNNVTSVYATVGFQKYEGIIDNTKKTVTISYPQQSVGTIIQITATDGFCTNTRNITIENSNLIMPYITLTRTQMRMQYDIFPKGCIIYAKIGDAIYQSAVGDGKYSEDAVILEYPLQKEGQIVSTWMESEDGSSTTPKEYTIKKCDLRLNGGYYLYAYPKQLSGSVNLDYAAVDYVTAQIGNETYQAKVDSKGNFVIEYPAQKVGESLIVTGYDEHGCSSDPIKTSVTNSSYIDTKSCIEHVYVSKAIGNTSYETGQRLCAQISDTVYYSEYSTTADQSLQVTYPVQEVGTNIKLWFEEKNGCYSDKIKMEVEDKQLYIDKYDLQTSFVKGVISSKIWWDTDEIKLKSATAEINGKIYQGTVSESSFSITFPKQKLSQKVKINVGDADGYTYTKTLEIVNIPIKLDVDTIYYSSTKVSGTTVPKANVAIQIGDKKYTTTANPNGDFSVNIKTVKAGTSVSITSTSTDGFYNTKSTEVKSQYGEVDFANTIYINTTTVKVTCINGNKGDVLTLKVGSKTYKKVLEQSKNTQTISFKITAQSAGKQAKVTLYDSFGKERGSDNTMVYIGDEIKVGMTTAQVVLTTWGAPVMKNDWGIFLQWVFERGSTTVYAYIRDRKVYSIQQWNY